MKASELRIGNYVNRDSSDYPQRIDGIKKYRFWMTCLSSSCDLSDSPKNIKPIPLNEEWLLKFGFTENTTSWTNWKKKNHCKEVRLIKSKKNVVTFNLNRINSVHQLQNLYFALTGEELKLKQND